MNLSRRAATFAFYCGLFLLPQIADADILKPGFKNVTHQLVFADTPFVVNNKLVAAPISGFTGIKEIKPATPFNFSTKYGTKIYLIPEGESIPAKFDKQAFAKFKSWEPPIAETSSLPVTSSIAKITTTIQFVGTGVDDAKLEVAKHIELDRHGKIAKPGNNMLWLTLVCAAGLAACLFAIRRMKKTQRLAAESNEIAEVAQPNEASGQ